MKNNGSHDPLAGPRAVADKKPGQQPSKGGDGIRLRA